MTKKGFTLIEILVSMTILVLTISIALFATVGTNGLIQRADTRAAITESGRTISDTIRQLINNAAVGTVGLPTAAGTDLHGTSMFVKTYASDKSQNVCHQIGRANKIEIAGKVSYAYNEEGSYIAYWIVPLGSSLECPTVIDTTNAIFQNQLTSDKTIVTDLEFSLYKYKCTPVVQGICLSYKQELRYSYTMELANKTVGKSQGAQQSSIQTASSVPIGLVNQTVQTFMIDTTTLPEAHWGDYYHQPIVATGGTLPYTDWKVVTGQLPAPLTINSDGIISGRPYYADNLPEYPVTISVRDATGTIATKRFSIRLVATDVGIYDDVISSGTAQKPYSFKLTTYGGNPSFTWSMESVVPNTATGLTLDPATGVLSWSSPTSGTWNLNIKVTDSSSPTKKWDSKTLVLNILVGAVAE